MNKMQYCQTYHPPNLQVATEKDNGAAFVNLYMHILMYPATKSQNPPSFFKSKFDK